MSWYWIPENINILHKRFKWKYMEKHKLGKNSESQMGFDPIWNLTFFPNLCFAKYFHLISCCSLAWDFESEIGRFDLHERIYEWSALQWLYYGLGFWKLRLAKENRFKWFCDSFGNVDSLLKDFRGSLINFWKSCKQHPINSPKGSLHWFWWKSNRSIVSVKLSS